MQKVYKYIGTAALQEEDMNSTNDLQTSAASNRRNVAQESSYISSHGTTLSFVSGPTFTAGSVTSVNLQGTPATYIPIQVPGVIGTAFTQTPAFAAPLIYPSTLTTAYISGPPTAPPVAPCTFLSAAAPITAMCHCIYAQPCALHHRPISYASHSFSSMGAVPATLSQSHSHTLPSTRTSNISSTRVTSLPPTLTLPSLRSSVMRLKRSGEQLSAAQSAANASESGPNIRLQKIRRVERSAEATTSDSTFRRHMQTRNDDGNTSDNSRPNINPVFCCDCRSRSTYNCPFQSCAYHHHHHICPRHPICFCSRRESSTSHRRETDINPVHDMLLSSRFAQIERQQQANNLWFQRQSMSANNLIGVDIVPRRVPTQPMVFLPRHQQQPIMELAMVLLQSEPNVLLGSAPHTAVDPLPVGATPDQIHRFSTVYRYFKESNVPENEQERCTVCLNNFEMNEEVRALRCSHVFHVVCIDRWLVYNKKCPVCRLEMDKTNGLSSVSV
ncbi:unnamed protein product [Thelazia callipaeda]|uniref:RING-type E3 ubiquitin transferase n=1 Tax=Thelazia callipaeda TaxID=103827 RepID=A0A0N5D5A5_THECL|nr:unnamed protein product [Thelazia callipaeda]